MSYSLNRLLSGQEKGGAGGGELVVSTSAKETQSSMLGPKGGDHAKGSKTLHAQGRKQPGASQNHGEMALK